MSGDPFKSSGISPRRVGGGGLPAGGVDVPDEVKTYTEFEVWLVLTYPEVGPGWLKGGKGGGYMSYLKDLDEHTEDELQDEIDRRLGLRLQGKCDYCGRNPGAGVGVCRFPDRHADPRIEVRPRQDAKPPRVSTVVPHRASPSAPRPLLRLAVRRSISTSTSGFSCTGASVGLVGRLGSRSAVYGPMD